MRITNRDELHPWRSAGPGPVPSRPPLTPQHPHLRTLRALQHHDAGGAPANVRIRRGWNDAWLRAPRNNVTRLPAARW
jgi:hypothetical protein